MDEFEQAAFADKEWLNMVNDLVENSTVQQMKNFPHHKNTSCFSHCVHVSYACYLFFKRKGWNAYYVARCGLLHDLFLYNRILLPTWWGRNTHLFTHGHKAMLIASELFDLSKKEMRAIARHMFPLTLVPPSSKEAWAICWYDKVWGLKEFRGYAT